MKTKTLLAAWLCVVLVAAVSGQQTAPEKKPATPTLEQLVEQLGDSDFRKRDIAESQLKAEGVKALPVLRASLKHNDPEVRRRLIELIPSIETAVVLAPKRVTLNAKDKTLNEIFAELKTQTGYRFEFSANDPNAKYTVDLKNQTFWETIDQISKLTGLDMQQGYGDDVVRLYHRGDTNGGFPHSCTDGAFRFHANSFQLYKHVNLTQRNPGANLRSESLTFTFSIQCEPKLPLLAIGQPRLTAAFDTEKNSMLVPSQPNQDAMEWDGRRGRSYSRYGNGNRMYYSQTQVYLQRVSEKAVGVKVMRGTVPVTLLAEQKPHVVAEKVLEGKGKKAVIGTTTIHIEEVTAVKNTNQIQVKLTFNEDTGGNPNDYSWQNAIYQRLEMQDAKGAKYQLYGTNWGSSNANSLQMTLTYAPFNQGNPNPNPKADENAKLVFHEWKVMQHQLNFEFKDLPLP